MHSWSSIVGKGVVRDCGIPRRRIGLGQTILADLRQVVIVRDVAPDVTVRSERYAECDRQASTL